MRFGAMPCLPKHGLRGWALLLLLVAPACCDEAGKLADEVNHSSYTHFFRNVLHTRTGDNRGPGTAQHDQARDRIAAALTAYGLDVKLHPFEWRGGTYFNVVGTLPGKTRPAETFIIGAHYDSKSNPGADDDASGVAALLEAARVASAHDFEATIVFIAFDLEEPGLIGSKAWVADHPAERIAGMISLDQVSFTSPVFNYNLIALCPPNTLPNATRTAFENAVRSYSAGLTPVHGGVTSNSDHAPFAALTSAIAVIEASWAQNTKMHTQADSVDEANYADTRFATRVTRSVAAYLAAQAGAIPAAAHEMRLRGGGILNAASSASGEVAASELVTLKGIGLTDAAGTTAVTLRDSTGRSAAAKSIYASDTQINVALPDSIPAGHATLVVTRGDSTQQIVELTVGRIAPGIFTADATGLGVAAAQAVRATPDGVQSLQNVADCSSGTCRTVPISFGSPEDKVALVLYGTGIRGRTALDSVQARVGGMMLPCQYAGPHPVDAGLDQVNVELPRSLRGLGTVTVELIVDGTPTLPVLIELGS